MRRQKILLAACTVALLIPGAAKAQYPQITGEAKAKIDSLQKVWTAHSDSAWAAAFPIVVNEAMHGRPYVPWAFRPYDLRQAKIPSFPGAITRNVMSKRIWSLPAPVDPWAMASAPISLA